MATARERLLQALSLILSIPHQNEGEVALKRLLNSYRVQAKDGIKGQIKVTARDQLLDSILTLWKEKSVLERRDVIGLISPFRMQIKQGLKKARLEFDLNAARPINPLNPDKQIKFNETKTRSGTHHENAYFRDTREEKKSAPKQVLIAGGPKQKVAQKGECPKCRSRGIVLNKSYEAEDHYSCVYCGFYTYINNFDPKHDLPMAADLLSSRNIAPEIDGDED